MGNIDSSSKSPSSNYRRSNTSKESEIPSLGHIHNKNYNLTKKNYNENPTNSQKESIIQNRSKKITDIIGVKLNRSRILNRIDSLNIVQMASKITNKVLNFNLDYNPINLISSSVVPNTKEGNTNFNLNKEILLNINSSFNSMILSEKFSESKVNEFKYKGNDKIYFNNLIRNNKSIGKYLNNLESKSREKLNNLFSSKNNEIDNLIKEKIEKFIKENESSVNLNLNNSDSFSQDKEIISGVGSKLSSDNNQDLIVKNYNKSPSNLKKNTSNSNINKNNESSYHNNNNNNNNESSNVIEKIDSIRYNTNNKTKVLKLDLSKTNLNKTKTGSNFNTTSRSKSPASGKYELMKDYNKSRLTGFFKNANRENSNNNSKNEISYRNSPKTSERKLTEKNVKEFHLKIKINHQNRSPDAKKQDTSNIRSNLKSNNNKTEDQYIIINTNNNKNNEKKQSAMHLDGTVKKEISSERNLNKKKLDNEDRSPNKNYSKSPIKSSQYTPLKSKNIQDSNQTNIYLNTAVIEYKPEKFNPKSKIIKTERLEKCNSKINHNINSDRNIGNYDYRNNSKDISINYGLTERSMNDYDNPLKNKYNQSRIPDKTIKSK